MMKLITFGLLLTGFCTLICASQMDIDLGKSGIPAAVPVVLDNTNTTTSTTSTTSTTTTTTTVAPDTTTVAPTTTSTTPKPAPYPEPSVGQWNSSCILIKMAAQLNFTYETKDNKSATALYNIPTDAKVDDSHCENQTQTIVINWGPLVAQHSMLLQFEHVNETVKMTMIRVILPLMSDRFPDAKDNQTVQLVHRGFDFGAPVKMSYHCTRPQTFNLSETVIDLKTIGTITVHDVQTEAFRSSNTTGFSSVHDCDSVEPSDIVPIAVGIALVALIMIVLTAYLCARRRSTSRGYMSF